MNLAKKNLLVLSFVLSLGVQASASRDTENLSFTEMLTQMDEQSLSKKTYTIKIKKIGAEWPGHVVLEILDEYKRSMHYVSFIANVDTNEYLAGKRSAANTLRDETESGAYIEEASFKVLMNDVQMREYLEWTRFNYQLGPHLHRHHEKILKNLGKSRSDLMQYGIRLYELSARNENTFLLNSGTQMYEDLGRGYFEKLFHSLKNPPHYDVLSHNCADAVYNTLIYFEERGIALPKRLPHRSLIKTPHHLLKIGKKFEEAQL